MNYKRILIISITAGFIIGLAGSILVFNQQLKAKENYLEINFINPREALIFWKTDHETIGWVKYGTNRWIRNQIEYQTSSEPSEVHAVVLEEVPLDGYYVSIHHESDSIFILPNVFKVQYNHEEIDD